MGKTVLDSADLSLICHPATPASAVEHLSASILRKPGAIEIVYVVGCDPKLLALPEAQKPYRTDGLWQTTCFELFGRDGHTGYFEFNFSPSTQWAAYRFSDYRAGMEPLELEAPPRILWWDEGGELVYVVTLDMCDSSPLTVNLTAVVEEADGTKSYWALAHPSGTPDFHHPDCFVLELAAPPAP